MKRISTSGLLFATLILSLVCSLQAAASSRGIRTDGQTASNGNDGWWICTIGSSCTGWVCASPGETCAGTGTAFSVSLPSLVELNPDGTTPEPLSSYSTWTGFGGPAAFVPFNSELQQDWGTPPGTSSNALGLMIQNTASDPSSQVVYFDLSGQAGQTVLCPDGLACPGNPTTSNTDAWEVEFNYSGTTPDGASFQFGSNLYTAPNASVLASSSDAFVYYDGTLYCPAGWTGCAATAPVPEPATLGLLGASATGCLIWFAARQRPRKRGRAQ